MYFKWKEDYSVNISEIDNQHKKLLELGDKIVYLANGDQNADYYDNIIEVLEELKKYTDYHFSFEERLMEKFNYKNIEEHKMQHHFFIKKVEQVSRKDIDGQQREVIMSLLSFIADWITCHILQHDKEFGRFLKSVGVE